MRTLVVASCLAACGGGQSPGAPDAGVVIDGVVVDGPCGADRLVTGELIDLDSSSAQFQGVFDARLTLAAMPAISLSTPPNGRIETCVPSGLPIVFDVDGPDDYLDGALYIDAEALHGFRTLSFRTFSAARAASLYAFDPSRGHVLVFLAGDRAEITLDRAHGVALSGDEDGNGDITFAPGTSGRYVLFPNVALGDGTATINAVSREHTVPVAAGTLTLAAVFFVFL